MNDEKHGMEPGQGLPVRDEKFEVWRRILKAAFALPGVKIDRAAYLRRQLSNYCSDEQVEKAIEVGPKDAGLPEDLIDRLANACMRSHVLRASAISFATGLPGGWAMMMSIPADVAQFFGHVIMLAQKLAYLYGPPSLLADGDLDELTEMELTLLIGVMMGAEGAAAGLAKVTEHVAKKITRDLPKKALTKTAFYPFVKSVGRLIGVQVTKRSFANALGKVVPVVGGVVSAGMTATMMWPMAIRLRDHFRAMSEMRSKTLGAEPVR